jgi:hypothetical protein
MKNSTNQHVRENPMVTLAELGFSQNTICETILCTYNLDGTPNAAAMGVTMQNSQQVILKIYNSAHSLKNLQARRSATLNLTGNIDVFYISALKDASLPTDWFEKSVSVDAPKLKLADATIAVAIDDFAPVDALRTKVTATVKQINASPVLPTVYCRAMPAVLEAVIHATRIKTLTGTKQEEPYVAKLLNLIQNCNDVVNRSAPNSHYAELMTDLQRKIESWRIKT